ncbi:cell wall-binding repeat-containing protein [Brevibacillus agri]|uniref:cell wall-binding repeat-containing protein n=1 Tax=Brevibacillus TaxID=55080 RepID=UPI0018CE1702|nr:cell wall-binding repeat-containing protein [Brevibacillus agri]
MMFSGNTVDTTRVWGESVISVMLNAYQMAYPGFPSAMVPWKPNAITIVPAEHFSFAFTAASLVHDPNNAPVMIVPERLTEEIRIEIQRLSPEGNNVPAQVFLVGPVSRGVEQDIQALGYSTLRIGNEDPYRTAMEASQFRLTYPPTSEQGKKNVFLISGEAFDESMFVPNYAMHQGIPVLLTEKDRIPAPVQQYFHEHPELNVYIVGSQVTVSDEVERSLHRLTAGKVTRISGSSPYDISVRFSRFFDSETRVGWNRNEKGKGDAFSFVNRREWRLAIISGLFSHLGKHAPLLLTRAGALPNEVRSYLRFLRPEMKRPPGPPFMHGFVFGNFDSISYQTQIEIEEHIIFPAQH